jgi:hypothetical protein
MKPLLRSLTTLRIAKSLKELGVSMATVVNDLSG